jgi:fructose-1,6-bisphosphatase/inositol monophosphatase family enzyme
MYSQLFKNYFFYIKTIFKCDSSISVGLAINRRLVLGIVSVPMIGHTYTAIKGKGAFLNGDQVTVSSDFSRTF